MKILVAVASKHGSTAEIGDTVAEVLREHGHEVRRADAEDADPGDADAVVLGSAVYMAQWMTTARVFVDAYAERLRRLPLFTFSSGLAGVVHGPEGDPEELPEFVASLDPIDHAFFSGRLDPQDLGLRERSVTRQSGARAGDYRDWDRIRAWAQDIAGDLAEHLSP